MSREQAARCRDSWRGRCGGAERGGGGGHAMRRSGWKELSGRVCRVGVGGPEMNVS